MLGSAVPCSAPTLRFACSAFSTLMRFEWPRLVIPAAALHESSAIGYDGAVRAGSREAELLRRCLQTARLPGRPDSRGSGRTNRLSADRVRRASHWVGVGAARVRIRARGPGCRDAGDHPLAAHALPSYVDCITSAREVRIRAPADRGAFTWTRGGSDQKRRALWAHYQPMTARRRAGWPPVTRAQSIDRSDCAVRRLARHGGGENH